MKLTNGDKMTVVKKVADFLDVGDIVTVMNVAENGMISFAFGDGSMHKGIMNSTECEEHFKKIEDMTAKIKAPTITEDYIAEIMENSEFETHSIFDNSIVVSCRLPNGYVITESYSCTSGNYDAELAEEICHEKIYLSLWI
mgnify:CR=1 FL=1